MISIYNIDPGEFPEGGNAEIVAGLKAHEAIEKMIRDSDLSFNEAGEWIDPWGTPYRFQANEKWGLDVVSAGPDRRFGTEDDL